MNEMSQTFSIRWVAPGSWMVFFSHSKVRGYWAYPSLVLVLTIMQ